jgi:hypothetical protein
MTFRIVKTVALLVLAVALMSGLAGCDLLGSSNDSVDVADYWQSPEYGDGFEITLESATWMFYQYTDDAKTVAFAGEIVGDPDYDADAAYLTMKITKSGQYGKAVGEYYRVHYKELGKDSVKEAAAYNTNSADSVNDGVPTLSEAQSEYTVDNGYFALYGTYKR